MSLGNRITIGQRKRSGRRRLCGIAQVLLFPFLFGNTDLAAPLATPEWTLEQARLHWKPMVRPMQHVGVPGYQFHAGVLWDGALELGPLDFRQLKVMQKELTPLVETH